MPALSTITSPANFICRKEARMACPFFMPLEKVYDGLWPHPSRLPLGSGWAGHCMAPTHENEVPSHEELADFCNLGYAAQCSRLPQDRSWDAVRFAVTSVQESVIRLRYVCERAHLPVDHGSLEFESTGLKCQQPHADIRVQKMAECFLDSYIEKKRQQTPAVSET
jgi:hypothetical protein